MTNLLIAGIGGQGVNTLANVLAEVCRLSGKNCQYTVHKGGAQSLGTVYAELRVASGNSPVLGSSIPKGKLDVLVAMDPWEALRHLPLAHAATKSWVESEIMPLFVERSGEMNNKTPLLNPLRQLQRLPLEIGWRHYRRDAIEQTGTPKMANYLAGLDCIGGLGINDVAVFEHIFFNTIPASNKYRESFCI